jgi:bifunctional non-homologous end joining protein LigD
MMKEVEELSEVWDIHGYELKVSKPNKLYWPKEGYTKLDLLNYYRTMAPILLPYLKDRPVTMHFFPRGIEDFSFYKRNFDDKKPDHHLFKTKAYTEKSQDKVIQVLLIDSTAGILYFAAKGGIEFHLWSAKAPKYEQPDLAIFDLDVGDASNFKNVLKVAGYLNKLLISNNIKAYPKTSGGTGLHVYVPIVPEYSYETIRAWVQSIAVKLAGKYPNLITISRDGNKTHNSDKVNIDHMQNVISRNTVAPYSVRAYPKAPVSTPLTWDEVKKGGFVPSDFTIKNIPERVEKLGDLFAEVLKHKEILALS